MSKPDTQSLHEFAWEIVLDHAQDIERMSVGEIMADNEMFEGLTEDEFDEVEAVVYDQARAYAKALMRPAEQSQDDGDVRAVAQLREEAVEKTVWRRVESEWEDFGAEVFYDPEIGAHKPKRPRRLYRLTTADERKTTR